ncbi:MULTISPECIES: DUF3313 family protein [unclassified Variovorax]|uniref:DUF3313 domain-containing protein n=1 Tax=unclassified Variovorax TaxID=663243 RepID=UPI003F486A0F
MNSMKLWRICGIAGIVAVTVLVTACSKPAPLTADAPAQASVLTLRPAAVTIADDLPGRVAAVRTAEIRPQVGGIIYRGSDAQFDDVSEDDKMFLARYMQSQFTEKLNARFRGASARNVNAVRIKLTLTGAKTNTAVLSTVSRFDLMGGPYNAVQAVRGREGAMTGSVSFAVEIYDASTNELLGAYVAKQYPNAWNLKAGIGARSASVVGIEKGADQLVAYLQ